jgi:hypothetical protein
LRVHAAIRCREQSFDVDPGERLKRLDRMSPVRHEEICRIFGMFQKVVDTFLS